jgi:hypothetical protein
MSRLRRRLDKIERALIAAHRAAPGPDLDDDWRRRLMADVKRQPRPGAISAPAKPQVDFSGPILKFAAATALAAVVVAVYFWLAGPDVDGELARLALINPTHLGPLQWLGVGGQGVLL